MKEDLRKTEEKYWQGKTTLEEEEVLRKAAECEDPALSSELITAMKLLTEKAEANLGEDFDEDFWQKADQKSRGAGKIFPLHFIIRYAAAAAVLAIIFAGAYHYFDTRSESGPQTALAEEDTFDDPEEAMQAALEALNFASEKLNKGQVPAREIKRFHHTKMTLIGKPAKAEK